MTDLLIETPNRVHVLTTEGRAFMLEREDAPRVLHVGTYLVASDAPQIGERAKVAGLVVVEKN